MYPKMDGLLRKTLLMIVLIWGYHHVRKHHVSIDFESFLLQLFGLVVEKSSGTTSEKRGLGNLCKKGDFLGKAILCKKGDFLGKSILCKKSDFLGTATFGKKVGFLRATFAKKVISLEQHPLQKGSHAKG